MHADMQRGRQRTWLKEPLLPSVDSGASYAAHCVAAIKVFQLLQNAHE